MTERWKYYIKEANNSVFGQDEPPKFERTFAWYAYGGGEVFGPFDDEKDIPNDKKIKSKERVCTNQDNYDLYKKALRDVEANAVSNFYNDFKEEYVDEKLTEKIFEILYTRCYENHHSNGYDSVYNNFHEYYDLYVNLRTEIEKER